MLVGILAIWMVVDIAGTWSNLARSDVHDDSDSAYYFQRGRELLQGRWATENVIVSHLTRYEGVEHPSFDHWQPLASLVSAAAGAFAGDSERGAKLALLLFGSVLLPALVYDFVRCAGGSPLAGFAAATLCLAARRIDHYRTVLDTVAFAAPLIVAAASSAVRAVARPRPHASLCAVSGVLLGLAALTRRDGLPIGLLACALTAALAVRGQRTRVGMLSLGAFIAVNAPLLGKNLVQFGSLVPPGVARVPALTNFCDWYAFDPASIAAPGSLVEWVSPRMRAARSAVAAMLDSPLLCASVALAIAALALGSRTGPEHERPRRLVGGLIVALGLYAAFNLVGILLAPALTLWSHRSPLPYWPVVIGAGMLSADGLVRRLQGSAWRFAVPLVALAIAYPDLTLDPSRRFRDPPRRIQTAYSEAAARLPPAAVVATNAPLALYVHHRGAIVRLPNDGASAIADAIRHYGIDYVVWFPVEDGCAAAAPEDGVLAGGIRLAKRIDGPSFRLYQVHVSQSGAMVAPPCRLRRDMPDCSARTHPSGRADLGTARTPRPRSRLDAEARRDRRAPARILGSSMRIR